MICQTNIYEVVLHLIWNYQLHSFYCEKGHYSHFSKKLEKYVVQVRDDVWSTAPPRAPTHSQLGALSLIEKASSYSHKYFTKAGVNIWNKGLNFDFESFRNGNTIIIAATFSLNFPYIYDKHKAIATVILNHAQSFDDIWRSPTPKRLVFLMMILVVR